MREFRREIALSIVGLLATVVGFAAGGPLWGFRVLGVFLLVSAAWIFAVGHAAYLIPGFKALYLDGKAAGAVTLANAAVGLLLLPYSSALAAWTYRACTALPVMRCEPAPVCVNAGITSLTSPARSVRAVRFTRTCDSKPPTTHVSILAVGEELGNQPGNVFAVSRVVTQGTRQQPRRLAWALLEVLSGEERVRAARFDIVDARIAGSHQLVLRCLGDLADRSTGFDSRRRIAHRARDLGRPRAFFGAQIRIA